MTTQVPKFSGWFGLKNRDIKRLSRFVVKHYKIPAYLRREAISEAYLGFVESSAAFDPSRGLKFTTLGVKYAKNRVFRLARREALRLRKFDTSAEGFPGVLSAHRCREDRTPDQIVADRESSALAMARFRELPGNLRDPVSAVVFDGMGKQEYASIVGAPRKTICNRIDKGLRIIREVVEPETAA